MLELMARKAKPPPVDPRDYGPEIRLKERVKHSDKPLPADPQRRLAAQRRAAAAQVEIDPLRVVVKEFRFDPDNIRPVLIRGGRVRDPLRKMWEARYITKRQWEGAEGFRDDCALAAGARLDQPDESGVRNGYSNRNWPSEAQVGALDRVTRTMGNLEPVERGLVVWSLIEHRPLTDFVREEGIRNEAGSVMLRKVLDYLARHHGPQH